MKLTPLFLFLVLISLPLASATELTFSTSNREKHGKIYAPFFSFHTWFNATDCGDQIYLKVLPTENNVLYEGWDFWIDLRRIYGNGENDWLFQWTNHDRDYSPFEWCIDGTYHIEFYIETPNNYIPNHTYEAGIIIATHTEGGQYDESWSVIHSFSIAEQTPQEPPTEAEGPTDFTVPVLVAIIIATITLLIVWILHERKKD